MFHIFGNQKRKLILLHFMDNVFEQTKQAFGEFEQELGTKKDIEKMVRNEVETFNQTKNGDVFFERVEMLKRKKEKQMSL